jgi:hypothetical protein
LKFALWGTHLQFSIKKGSYHGGSETPLAGNPKNSARRQHCGIFLVQCSRVVFPPLVKFFHASKKNLPSVPQLMQEGNVLFGIEGWQFFLILFEGDVQRRHGRKETIGLCFLP